MSQLTGVLGTEGKCGGHGNWGVPEHICFFPLLPFLLPPSSSVSPSFRSFIQLPEYLVMVIAMDKQWPKQVSLYPHRAENLTNKQRKDTRNFLSVYRELGTIARAEHAPS